jgi:hypothetical protein
LGLGVIVQVVGCAAAGGARTKRLVPRPDARHINAAILIAKPDDEAYLRMRIADFRSWALWTRTTW